MDGRVFSVRSDPTVVGNSREPFEVQMEVISCGEHPLKLVRFPSNKIHHHFTVNKIR